MNRNQQAKIHDRERRNLEKIGVRNSFRISNSIRVGVLKSYRNGQPVGELIINGVNRFTPIIQRSMTMAYFQGRLRSVRTLVKASTEKKKKLYSNYDEATQFFRRRMELTADQILAIHQTYGAEALLITKGLGDEIEKRAQKSIKRTIDEGKHVREGIIDLRREFNKMGITPTQPHLFETLVRTQIQIAYSAGRWQANQDPVIQEILWGYVYTTVGDDRVRITHDALDGTKLTKDDPQWSAIWPPNGYNCRCSTIEIFDEGTEKRPPETTIDDNGQEIAVQPDQGFAFNPGNIFAPPPLPDVEVKGKKVAKKRKKSKNK